ncbi:hypothetical protein [Hansschlegelia zhihuaiae]|uniref:Uncharacterized protein n=1 Tax=Hansschlegelia zhihuaiae TaxID=405005 RepID=A0A4Q0MEX2_9HYPH|nr:hypothetical protein [Hansschlegelia zhihuaiae]RXF71998.1 hypothetical protein EK403_14320 [Hansschlegelia zhihuaiae]
MCFERFVRPEAAMEPKLRCTVTEDEHETRLEIIQDDAHRAQVLLNAEGVETLIRSLAACRAENPEPTLAEELAESKTIDLPLTA